MVKTASTMRQLGTPAPDFSLINVDGQTVSLSDFKGQPGLLVIFMCNHCPFVKHVAPELAVVSAPIGPASCTCLPRAGLIAEGFVSA